MKTAKINCRISKRNIVCGGTQHQDGLRVTLEDHTVVTTKEMADSICHASSLTQADIQSALTSLSQEFAQALSMGRSVELEGIGTFSLNIGTVEPKMTSEVLKADDICVKGVTFRPAKSLMTRLSDVHFSCGSDISVPVSSENINDALRAFFADSSFGGLLTVKRFASLCNCSETTARTRVKALVSQHILEPSPFAPHCYVAGEAL